MDWTMMLTAVLTFVGGGGLGAVLMFPQKRKSAELENETKASEQWKELYIKSQEENYFGQGNQKVLLLHFIFYWKTRNYAH